MTVDTYTVAELTRAITYALDDVFPDDVWITGEISGLSRSRGHVFFDLVEPRDEVGEPAIAQLSVALFSTNKAAVNHSLRRAGMAARMDNGVRVRIRGAVAFNERNGRLQVRMTGIDPVYTLGQLAIDRDRVVRVLREAGLLDRNAQVPLPAVPLRVGLVTSAGSAAYHDFVHELDTSGLAFRVTFVDAKVQGVGAGEQVVRALRRLARTDVDVIALVRGGGSRADLATFDSEQLARTIALLDRPVLTGVGHEVDRSIADDVSHTAYKTPTACAASLVARVRAYCDATEDLWAEIARVAQLAIREQHELVGSRARASARAARSSLRAASTDADNLATRLAREATHTLARAEHQLERRRERSGRAARGHLARGSARLDASAHSIRTRIPREITALDRQLDLTEARLRALDPTRLLARGWSITRRADGAVVRSVNDLVPDDILVTRVVDGAVRSIVTEPERAGEAEHHG
jgi:exodeoxyribonuclease VII large subunit